MTDAASLTLDGVYASSKYDADILAGVDLHAKYPELRGVWINRLIRRRLDVIEREGTADALATEPPAIGTYTGHREPIAGCPQPEHQDQEHTP